MVTLVRYGEIATKSDYVRKQMEGLLVRNIKDFLRREGISAKVRSLRGRIIVSEDVDLKRIFGVVSFSHAKEIPADIEVIKETAYALYKGEKFRISAQRLNKAFPLTSQEINRVVGEYIFNKGGKVDLKNFDQEIFIEIINNKAYVFDSKMKGPGGLPLGATGRMLAVINCEKDEYAALLMMKRGICIDYLGEAKIIHKWDYGCPSKKLEGSIDDHVDKYLGLIVGLEIKNQEELNKFKDLFAKYKKVYAPLFGYDVNEVKNLWKE